MAVSRFSPMVGTLVKATIAFVDTDGVLTDPTTATVTTRDPAGVVTPVVPVTNVGVGIYEAEFIATLRGTWFVQAKGVGAVAVVDEVQFDVRASVVTP